MSRGPGKWQRVVLSAIEAAPAVYLRHLLPDAAPRSAYVALQRGVATLRESGHVGTTLLDNWRRADGRLVVHRVGLRVTRARGSRELCVFHVNSNQHLPTAARSYQLASERPDAP